MKKLLKNKISKLFALSFALVFSITAFGAAKNTLKGDIIVDGSSTIFPITEAVAEEFRMVQSGVNVSIGVSGTGGGFKKFVKGEIDINNASRPIKDSEIKDAKANGIEYVEIKIAFDGLTVAVNPKNKFLTNITVEELNKIWAPDSKVKLWSDVNPKWPKEAIKLYGAGTDSGTFDYFTEVINGKSGSIRKDFTPSEDDHVLVKGVTSDKNAMGFFGFSYYLESKNKLKAVKINGVEPNFTTIKSGKYSPLSRPMFIYINKKSLTKPHVKEFIRYYLTEGTALIKDVGYVEMNKADYAKELNKIK